MIIDHPVHTITNYNPTNVDVLPTTFLQIILDAKWFVWHSSIVRPPKRSHNLRLPFCIFSFFYACRPSELGGKNLGDADQRAPLLDQVLATIGGQPPPGLPHGRER